MPLENRGCQPERSELNLLGAVKVLLLHNIDTVMFQANSGHFNLIIKSFFIKTYAYAYALVIRAVTRQLSQLPQISQLKEQP